MDPAEQTYTLELTATEVKWMVTILDAYGNDWYSHEHSSKPLDDLRARVDELAVQVEAAK